jgi:hypothetical protein
MLWFRVVVHDSCESKLCMRVLVKKKLFFAKTDKKMHMCLYECRIVLLEIPTGCMSSYYVQKQRSTQTYHFIIHECIDCYYQARLFS